MGPKRVCCQIGVPQGTPEAFLGLNRQENSGYIVNTGLVFGDDEAITAIFAGVHNASWIVNSRKRLIQESRG